MTPSASRVARFLRTLAPVIPKRILILAFASLTPLVLPAHAFAQNASTTQAFDIPAGDARPMLRQFAAQSKREIVFPVESVDGVKTHAVKGEMTAREAVNQMLAGTGLVAALDEKTGAFAVRRENVEAKNAPRAALAKNSDRPGENNSGEEKTVELPVFEVFGSKLLNMDLPRSRDDAQPYVIFNRTTIEQSGTDNLDDFFKTRLPMNSTAQTNAQLASSNGSKSVVNLRGLGQNQTLVLVDGHRIADFGSANPQQADLNWIPLGAIERVEVLPTTASGIYGGGATGGVVNVILRRDYNGAEAKVGYDNTVHSDASTHRIDFNSGFTLEHGKTSVLLAASYADQGRLEAQDRDFEQRGRARIFANNPGAILSTSAPMLGATTNIRSATGTNLVLKSGTALNSPFTFAPAGYNGAASDNGAALVPNAGRYNLALAASAQALGGGRNSLLNNSRTESLMATVRRQFGHNFQAFLEVWSSDTRTKFVGSSFASYTFTIPSTVTTNPFQQNIQVSVPSAAGDIEATVTMKNLQLVGGVIVALPRNWSLGLDQVWSRATDEETGSRVLTAAGTAAFAGGTLDPLRDSSLFPLALAPYFTDPLVITPQRSTSVDTNLRVGGPFAKLPAGSAVLAASLEYRDEKLNDSFQIVPTVLNGYIPSRSQSVQSGYIEARLPLFSAVNARPALQELELQLAGRIDRYTTHGANQVSNPTSTTVVLRPAQTASSNNPTVALRWKPVRDLMLRGSYGTGFLPPSVTQLVPSFILNSQSVVDPRRGGTTAVVPPAQIAAGGNPNLQPEKSRSSSVGAVFTPHFVPGLRLSVDYTRIHKTDNIQTLVPQQIVDNEASLPGRVVRGANLPGDAPGWPGPITGLNASLTNLAAAKVEAYDAAADYEIDSGLGRFGLFAAATWETHYKTQVTPSAAFLENAGITYQNPLKFKGSGGVTWKRRGWTAGWSISYFDSYLVANPTSATAATLYRNQGSTRVPDQIYHDAFVTYRFGAEAVRWLAHTELQVGGRNIFNARPPVDVNYSSSGFDYSPYGDPRMARYHVSLKRTF